MSRLRLAAAVFALMLSSIASADLRTYDVDPELRQEIYAALSTILNASGPGVVNGGSYGRVELLPSGQLLVNAPADTLGQVDQVVQAIRNRPAPAAPRVELRYWAVLGSRAPVANPPGTATPTPLNPVLAELRKLHGDLSFRVIGQAALTTQSGQHGEISGMLLEVEQTAFVQGDALNARIEMQLQGRVPPESPGPPGQFNIGSIEVRAALRRGEFVVLGQSELVGGGLDGPVFFIVHWPEAGAR